MNSMLVLDRLAMRPRTSCSLMITIVDYEAGNLTSVQLAFQALGVDATITRDPADVAKAERVVFPGVGAAGAAMDNVQKLELSDALKSYAGSGKPFLGICVGMQILFEHSEEDGGTPCLGLLPGDVVKFRPSSRYDKIPQIGWNAVDIQREHPVFAEIENGSEFYFVHSYYAPAGDEPHILGVADYADARFCAVAALDNIVATQFHAEKSGQCGLKILENFSRWEGTC